VDLGAYSGNRAVLFREISKNEPIAASDFLRTTDYFSYSRFPSGIFWQQIVVIIKNHRET